MPDSPEQGQGDSGKKRVVFAVLSLILVFGAGFYISAAGSAPGFFKDATAIVSQTLKGVLGFSSDNGKTTEIDLNSPTVPRATSSSDKAVFSAGTSSIPAGGKKSGPKSKNEKLATSTDISFQTEKQLAAPEKAVHPKTPKKTQSVPSSTADDSLATAPDCDFLSVSAPNHQVIFNEVAWMGSPSRSGETTTTASAREWMELKNVSHSSLDVSGWQILDESERFNIAFDKDRIADSGFYLLERKNDDSVPGVTADKIYNGALSNSGMWLKLFDSACFLIDEINATSGWPGGDNSSKKTLERNSRDFGWHTSVDPGGTPKKENSVPSVQLAAANGLKYTLGVSLQGDGSGIVKSTPLGISCIPDCSHEYLAGTKVAFIASSSIDSSFSGWSGACSGTGECTLTVNGAVSVIANFKSLLPPSVSVSPAPPPPAATTGTIHLVIAEVQIAGASTSNDFVKIYNPTASSFDVSGWKLRKRTQTENVGDYYSLKVFPAGSSVAAQGYFVWANSGNGFSESIGADTSSTETLAANNSIALLDVNGAIVDALAWGSGHVSPYVEGSAYPTNPTASQVLQRKFVNGGIQDTDDNSADFMIQ